jgi:putative transposase
MLHVHLVFLTKYRGDVLQKNHLVTLRQIFFKICEDFDAQLIEFNGGTDHVHLLITYPVKFSVTKLVNSLKGVSSRKLKKAHPELIESSYLQNVLWSPSYFAGSVGGGSINAIKEFIEDH